MSRAWPLPSRWTAVLCRDGASSDGADSDLRRTIDSALNQTVSDIQVPVVLDDAHHETAAVARARGARDARARGRRRCVDAASRGESPVAPEAPRSHAKSQSLDRPVRRAPSACRRSRRSALARVPSTRSAAQPHQHHRHRHTTESYRGLPRGLVVPEADIAADLTLWRQFLEDPAIRAATHPEVKTLRFPAPEHIGLSPTHVERVRASWERLTRNPDAHDGLQELAILAVYGDLFDASLELRAMTVARARDQALISSLIAGLDAHRGTLSWRMSRLLRAMHARLGRRTSSQ